jgi:hypothetical protein
MRLALLFCRLLKGMSGMELPMGALPEGPAEAVPGTPYSQAKPLIYMQLQKAWRPAEPFPRQFA